jgi:hypothetical protein
VYDDNFPILSREPKFYVYYDSAFRENDSEEELQFTKKEASLYKKYLCKREKEEQA